jgi:subtilase family serine protease
MQNQNWRLLSRIIVVAVSAVVVVSFSTMAAAQGREAGVGTAGVKQEAIARGAQAGRILTPPSSIARPEDAGLRAHTNIVLRSLDGTKPLLVTSKDALTAVTSNDTVENFETPYSMGCLYVSSPSKRTTGCVPTFPQAHGPSAAGWGAIALVDAFDNPNIAGDLKTFIKTFSLPAANFTKVIANGNGDCIYPPVDPGWAIEESLDVEWAHVFASKAQIVLVEACSNSYTDLLYAESVAIDYIAANYGGGDVSNSWGSEEFSGETAYDPIFTGFGNGTLAPITTFASAGDSGCGAAYPSSNPWLVSAGGTSVLRNDDLTFNSEACWAGSGGGSSVYETYATTFTGSNTGPWADYQYPIFDQASRQTPDLAFNADPASGVIVDSLYYGEYYGYCATQPCLWIVGGTSVASPSLASITNRANNQLSTWFGYTVAPPPGYYNYGYFTNEENNLLYSQLPAATAYYTNFYDITTGSNGCSVTASWDYCTGVGSPRDLLGK